MIFIVYNVNIMCNSYFTIMYKICIIMQKHLF